MIAIVRKFEWDMGHRIPDHGSLCRNPHGHRYVMELTFQGLVQERAGSATDGMIADFGDIKRRVNEVITDVLDHSFMYSDADKPLQALAESNPGFKMLAVPFAPTAERIVGYIAEIIQATVVPAFDDMKLAKVVLYETPNCRAEWSSV